MAFQLSVNRQAKHRNCPWTGAETAAITVHAAQFAGQPQTILQQFCLLYYQLSLAAHSFLTSIEKLKEIFLFTGSTVYYAPFLPSLHFRIMSPVIRVVFKHKLYMSSSSTYSLVSPRQCLL